MPGDLPWDPGGATEGRKCASDARASAYLVSPGPTLRAEVDGLQREFSVTNATLAVAGSGAESALRAGRGMICNPRLLADVP